MFARSFRQFFAGKKRPIVNSKKAPKAAKARKRPHLGLELLEDRVTPTTITQWNFSASPAVINTQNGTTGNTVNQFAAGVEPTTGSGSIYTLGMYNTYNGGNSASDDILSTAGTADSGFSENLLRVRGSSHNGWATHAAGAAQYTQGIEVDASTAGFTNISFTFDWYSTNQAIRDLQVQYNTNVNNANGWTNFAAPGGTGSNGISTSGTFLATPNDYWNATSTNGADPITVSFGSYANNDPNFGVRLVSAYDSTGNVTSTAGPDYASATLGTGGVTQIYNNNSGNWRFDNLTFSAGSAASDSSALTVAPVSPQNPGTSVTLTDAITPTGGGPNPTGTVMFFDGATQIGATQNVTPGSGSTGVASLAVNTSGSPLSLGVHNFTAQYVSTNNYPNSTTANVGYTIGDPTSSVVTDSPASPQQVGTSVTFTDTITPANIGGTSSPDGNPTGTVQFFDGAAALGSPVTVSAGSGTTGVASYTDLGTLASGTHNITAVFTPTGNFLASTSPAVGYALYSGTPGPFTPGNLVILQAGDGVNQYNAQGPLFLDEINATTGANVQQVAIPATAGVGNPNNQPITIDLSAAAGNGQLTRSYDGSALSFDGIDSTVNNGGLTPPATPTGSDNRVVAVVTGDPTVASDINTTTDGPFYVGDDNRGSVAESPTGPIYTAGHPNQAGGAVSQGVHEFDTEGPSIGTQVSASTNIRGVNIGFDNRMYFSTAGGLGGVAALNTAGIFTEAQALPTAANTPTVPLNDIQVVPALFSASKLGGLFLADMNGDGVIDNGDRLYFVDDGTVGGAGTGGLYVSTWNDGNTNNPWNTPNNAAAAAAGFVDHWSAPVRLGDAPIQTGSGGVGQLRGLTGTVINSTTAVLYTTAYDNAANDSSYVQQWTDSNTGVAIASASESGTTVTVTTATPNGFTSGQMVEVDGVGANNGAAAVTSGYNGAWSITVIDSTHFTYTDTNTGASNLATVNNQGAADVTVNGSIIDQLAAGSDQVGSKTFGDIGLRGVAFAPVAATTVSLSQSPANPLSPGTAVTLTATLTNAQVTPTGTVTFIDQNTNTVLGQGVISTTGGVTTATFTTTLVGNHYVKAYFAGGGPLALASANSNTIQVIEAGSTVSTTSVTSSLAAAAIAKPVTLTATVNAGATGTVSFFNGTVSLANLLGTSVLSGTTASLTTAFGTAGTQNIIAVYNGDNTYASSQGTTTVNVAANATATIITSANNVALNATPTYTATVVGNAILGTPAGTVVFTIISATTNASGVAIVNQTSAAITLTAGPNNTATATWVSPALSVAGSYFVTVAYTATGATNPYSNFAVNTTTATNGVALIETVQKAFTPGNLVAVQRGDGTVNLGSAGYPVFLDEYTPAGALVQSIALPNVDSGTQHALFLSGQNGSEGLLNRSANGAYLTLAGYDLPVGHTFVTSTFPYQFPRSIAEVNLGANIDTSTAISTTQASITAASESGTTVTITTAAPHGFTVGEQVVVTGISPAGYDGQVTITGVTSTTFTYTAASGLGSATLSSALATSASVPYNPLDVVSNDGSEFWLASNLPVGDTTDSGIEYVSGLGATSATQIVGGNVSAAAISISGGQLYVTKGSGNVQAVGTGLPTTPGQTLTGLPDLATEYAGFFPNKQNPEQVLLLNTNDGTSNNPNVAYIADQANGLLKFWLNTASISTLTESGTTVTVTTAAANTLVTGEQVQIAGASAAGYNGVFTITVTDATHFTYTATGSGLANATGGTASQWTYGGPGGSFGQKLIFAGGATGVTGYVINPGTSNAQVQLYITGSNVQQQNPNQLDSFLDTNAAPLGMGSSTINKGFPGGNVTNLGFVGGASPSGSPNGNENFAGLAFVPGFATTTIVTSSAPTTSEGSNVTYTATVADNPASGNTPTGVVEFFDGGTLLGQGTLNGSGVATFTTTTPLAVGAHNISAAYQGDVKDDTSTGTVTQNVDFTAGDLIVSQVGTGSGSLTSSATATFLDEFTTSGTATGTSVALPTASTLTASITGITESGTTATATTSAAHGFATGEKVTVTGSSVSGYNATFTITGVTATTFTFTAASGLGSATGGAATVTNALTEGGTTTTEGYLTDAADGHSLSIAGYNVAPGSSTSGVNRDVGVVGANGAVDISTQLPSAVGSVRVAISADGLGFWVATSTGVAYVPFGNAGAASTQVTNEVGSPTAVGIGINNTSGMGSGTPGQLFASAGAGAQSNGVPALDSPFTVGAGLPTDGGQSIAVSPSFPTARDIFNNFPSTNQFAVSPDGNTIYIADSRTDGKGGILKYFQSSANNWTLVSSLQLNSFGITDAKESGTTVTITTAGAYSFPAGQKVEIDGVGTGYNGSFLITVVDATHFTYTATTSGLAEVSNAGVATSTDGGIRPLVADFSGANPVLYATTTAGSSNRIVKLVDGGDLSGNPGSGFTATTLATAPTNEAFRGVALAPKAAGTAASTTTLAATNTPATYGTGVTLTATVTSGATGWVSFRVGGVEIGAAQIVGNTAVFTTAGNLPAGTYSNITAVYTGDSIFAASTSAAQSAVVNQATAGVSLTLSANPVATGVNDTMTATLTSVPAGTAPTGTVTFKDGSTTLGTGTISQVIVNQGGNPVITFVATFTTSFSTIGSHSISAVYGGDTNFAASTGTASLLVVNPTTTTVTTDNADPTATPSATVHLTATVTSPGGTPTGTVQFYDNLIPIGTAVTLNGSGVGTVAVSTALLQAAFGNPDVLTPGLHSISAVYTPDASGANTFFTSTGVYEQAVQAQAFGAGDEFVYRVGDGTTNLIAQAPNPLAGAASIGSTIYIDEYTPAGVLVQSIILPSADGTGAQNTIHAVVGNGQQSATGQMSLSGDGQYLFVAGYDNNPLPAGTALGIPTATGNSAVPRSIARIKYDGTVQSIAFTAGSSGVESNPSFSNFNGVYSPDGNQFYLSGGVGVYYGSSFAPSAAALQTPTLLTNIGYTTLGLEGAGGDLYAVGTPYTGANLVGQFGVLPTTGKATISAASESGTTVTITTSAANGFQTGEFVAISGVTPSGYNGTFQIAVVDATHFTYTAASGLGTATLSSAAAAPTLGQLPGLPSTDTAQQFPIDVYFTHLNGTGAPAGINTMYISDDGPGFANGEITKWALSSTGSWSLVDSVTAGSGNAATTFYWLAGRTDGGGNVTLDVTYGNGGNGDTGPGFLYSIIDQNGWNAPIGTGGSHSSAVTQVATVPTGSNEVFRGVANAPVAVQVATTTTLTDNGPNPSTNGQAVSFTATVAGGSAISGETVNVEDADNSNAIVATPTLTGGTVTFNISTLAVGTHHLFAVYGGDAGHLGSQSAQVSQVVNALSSTTTTLTDNGPNPSSINQPVSFTVAVSGGTAVSGETVSIEDADNSNAIVATPTLTSGTATFNISSLAVGTHHLFAVYAGDGTHQGSQSGQDSQVVNNNLIVLSATPTNSGVVVTFNQAINPAVLNLYTNTVNTGPADLTLVGGSVGSVKGSLIDSSGNTQVYFVRTGGVLAADTYTLTVKSGATAFETPSGGLLFGNGTSASDFTSTFTTATSTAPVVSLPDFVRGAGEVDAAGNPYANGLPLTISNGAGLTSAQVTLTYNPTLFTPTGATTALAGYAISNFAANNGVATFTVSGGAALGAGAATLASIQYTIPAAAPYASKEALQLSVTVNGGAIAVQNDDAVHVAAYYGDIDGNQSLTSNDAAVSLKVATAAPGTGFDKFKLADPVVISDIDGNGLLAANDASIILKKVVSPNSVSQIPSFTSTNPPAGGPDPRLYIGTADPTTGAVTSTAVANVTATAGSTFTVAVNMQVTESGGVDFQAADIGIAYNQSELTVSNVRVGHLTSGFLIQSDTSVTNQLQIGLAGSDKTVANGTNDSMVLIDFTVNANAPLGSTPLNLVQDFSGRPPTEVTNGNNQNLTLSPAPTNAPNDANVDGTATVAGPTGRLFFPTSTNATAGSTITVPVNLQALTSFQYQAADIGVAYDPSVLTVQSVTTGSLTNGFLIQYDTSVTGQLQIGVAGAATTVNAGAVGDFVDITFKVNANASGSTALNIVQGFSGRPPTEVTQPNNQNITLSPAPTNAATDANVDGTLNIVIQPNQPPFDKLPAASAIPPVLFNPAARAGLQTATPNTDVFSTANGDAITVTDSDYAASGPAETTTITLTGSGSSSGPVGTLSATAAGAATLGGNGTATLTITGSLTDITSTLNGLTYTPGAGYYGVTTLTVSTDDNGNSGFGGPQTDTRSTSITVVGLFESEIDLLKGTTTNPSQYVEIFSTAPSYTIPTGVYLVGINGVASTPVAGLVTDIFNLGGFTTGTNGYLALLEKGEKYVSLGDTVAGGNVLDNIGTAAGFGNGGTTSKFGTTTGVHAGGARRSPQLATDIATGAESFLLIQAATAPTTSVNIDPGNTGNPTNQTSAYNSWNVLDSVGILDAASTSHSYAALTFRPASATGSVLSGSNVVATGTWTATYVGRIAQNTGSSGADWLASQPTGAPTTGFVLGTNSTQFAGQSLNNVGGPNYWAPEETVIVNDGSSNQHSQVSELTVTFNEPVNIANLQGDLQVKDAQGNVLSTTVIVIAGTDNGDGTASGVTQLLITFNAGSIDTFTFGTPFTDVNGNTTNVGLNDGNFFLNSLAADITNNGVALDGAHNGVAGSTSNGTSEIDEFWRLFGDTLGRRHVDATDQIAFNKADHSTSAAPNYVWFLDFNEDGSIDDATDRVAFRQNVFKQLKA